ncbi:MAG: hypothetical protein IT282_16870 [Bacteroidetes bacterium]|nr:hypothetical protein [Bacteroidota bacterium]
MRETIVCVAASECTWKNLRRYCFNAAFRANRHRFDLAVGFNGYDPEAIRFIDTLTPEYLLTRPNTGHDLANFDNILKRVPAHTRYILMHDDHWFFDEEWFDRLLVLLDGSPEIGVFGNLVPYDVQGPFREYYDRLCTVTGYDDVLGHGYPHFLQGLAGIYRGEVIQEVLACDGIPHLHRSIQAAAQVFERVFSALLLNQGVRFAQIPPGFELFLVHRDHSIILIKLEQAAHCLDAGDRDSAENIFAMLKELRPDDADLMKRIEELRAGRRFVRPRMTEP